jgi:hypothetical protein
VQTRITVRHQCQRVSMGPSYPRRQQYRRMRRAMVSEGDLVGKSREQIRSLHFRRDRDWLQS